MREERLADAAIVAMTLLIAVCIALVTLVRPAEAVEFEPDWTWQVYPSDHTNVKALVEMKMDALDDKLKLIGETETARLEREAQEAWEAEQAYYTDSSTPSYSGGGTYYAAYSSAYNTDGPSRTMPGWFDGYLETYYSSNTLHHYRTNEWSVDSEGFYRTSDGYYVVGVDINEGIPLGTVVDTGKGEAVVMDYGSGAHVHDFYTNW